MTEQWRGIFKLIEEMGEVQQVLGKLGPFPDGNHPDDGPDLKFRLINELADLEAAIKYVYLANNLSPDEDRRTRKLQQFVHWTLTGISTRSEQ